jgi:hypothetical protein
MMDIKKILKHIDGVEGKQKIHKQLNEAASMIINGDNADDVGIILDRIKGVSSPAAPAPQGNNMRGDMDKFLSVMGPREPVDMNMGMGTGMDTGMDTDMELDMGDDDDGNLPALANSPNEKYADVSAVTTKAGGGLNGPKNPKDIRVKDASPYQDMDDVDDEDDMDEWANEPEEEETDHDTMLNDLSGGINRQKKMFPRAQPGDNAMAVESIKARLLKALAEANSKPDFLDMDKDGNKKEPMKKAVADKKKKMKEAAKPDFLDMDKDGNKKEPMKGAAKDAKKGKMPPQFKKK